MAQVKAPDVPRPRPANIRAGCERRDEIQSEITRLLEKVDRLSIRAFPLTAVTVVAHEVAEYADRTMTEKACRWLYDYNRRQAEAHGARAVLSVRDFTVDVDEFRKAMESDRPISRTD